MIKKKKKKNDDITPLTRKADFITMEPTRRGKFFLMSILLITPLIGMQSVQSRRSQQQMENYFTMKSFSLKYRCNQKVRTLCKMKNFTPTLLRIGRS